MKWVIKSTNKKTGNSYYLTSLRTVDGIVRPINCRLSHISRVAVFPSVAAACATIRQVTSLDWCFRIRPETSVFWRSSQQGGARQ